MNQCYKPIICKLNKQLVKTLNQMIDCEKTSRLHKSINLQFVNIVAKVQGKVYIIKDQNLKHIILKKKNEIKNVEISFFTTHACFQQRDYINDIQNHTKILKNNLW